MGEGWKQTTFGEAADEVKVRTGSPSTSGLRHYVGLEHLAEGEYRVTALGRASDVSSAKTVFQAGDLLYGKLRPYLRKSSIAPVDGVCSTDILVYRGRTGVAVTRYLALVVASEDFAAYAIRTSAGTRMPRASARTLAEFPFVLPPLREQRRIVDLVSALDGCIGDTRAYVERSQTLGKSILGDCFQRLLRGKTVRVSDLLLPSSKVSYGVLKPGEFTQDGPLMVRGQDIRGGRIDHTALVRITPELSARYHRTILRGGEVVIALVGTTGHAAVADGRLAGANVSRAVGVIPCDLEVVRPQYLVAFFESPVGRQMTDRVLTGAVQKVLNLGALRDIEIPLPTLAEQDEVYAMYDALSDVTERSRVHASRFQGLRSSLLSELLTGRHEIPQSYDELFVGL